MCVRGGAKAPHKKGPPQPTRPGGHRPEPRGNVGCMPTNRNIQETTPLRARIQNRIAKWNTNKARGDKEHSMKSHIFPAYVSKPNQTQNSPGRDPTLSPGLRNFPLAHLRKHKLMLRLFASYILCMSLSSPFSPCLACIMCWTARKCIGAFFHKNGPP